MARAPPSNKRWIRRWPGTKRTSRRASTPMSKPPTDTRRRSTWTRTSHYWAATSTATGAPHPTPRPTKRCWTPVGRAEWFTSQRGSPRRSRAFTCGRDTSQVTGRGCTSRSGLCRLCVGTLSTTTPPLVAVARAVVHTITTPAETATCFGSATPSTATRRRLVVGSTCTAPTALASSSACGTMPFTATWPTMAAGSTSLATA